MSEAAVRRLHIAPLDAGILDTVLHPSIRPLATDISLCTVETHPENNYGFVTLPAAEADRVTKKLNGAILKGKRLRIEQARPFHPTQQLSAEANQQRPEVAIPSEVLEEGVSLKQKAVGDTVEGYQLPSSRKVMRGWTEPRASAGRSKKKDEEAKQSKSQSSKYSNGPECLFRTVPPANKSSKEKSKSGKSRETAGSVTVHEFKRTTKHPSFLKSGDDVAQSKLTNEYVEGKGWVDRDGNVKEQPPKKSKRPESARELRHAAASITEANKKAPEKESKVSGSESEPATAESSSSEDWTSSEASDGDSASEESDSDSSSAGPSSSSAASDSGQSEDVKPEKQLHKPAEQEKATPAQINPLEALFKRPKTPGGPTSNPQLTIDTQFSFFGNAEDSGSDIEANERYAEPQTPFTALDRQARSMRSLAPTPDTALPTKTVFWGSDAIGNGVDDDGLDEAFAAQDPALSPSKPGAKRGKEDADESEFAKWFWENRGDNNRAWKRRRREAGKEKRQKDNRSHSSRGRR